jgi:hypothetical protein
MRQKSEGSAPCTLRGRGVRKSLSLFVRDRPAASPFTETFCLFDFQRPRGGIRPAQPRAKRGLRCVSSSDFGCQPSSLTRVRILCGEIPEVVPIVPFVPKPRSPQPQRGFGTIGTIGIRLGGDKTPARVTAKTLYEPKVFKHLRSCGKRRAPLKGRCHVNLGIWWAM